jgi:hypothetical protein
LPLYRTAVAANDQAALGKLFGPEFHELMTGDKVQDANNLKKFATDLAERCHPVKDGDDKITLEIGPNNWPMPIPLSSRRMGNGTSTRRRARKRSSTGTSGKTNSPPSVFVALTSPPNVSTPAKTRLEVQERLCPALQKLSRKKDGLYWAAANNEPASPFGPLVAEAQAEGYVIHKKGTGPHPFHGYYFRILTRQGEAAPGGKMSYLSEGAMTKGFALVAYPEHWDQSGVMTFIVNQDGKVSSEILAKKRPKWREG